jgi:hypothetical protein
VGKQADGKQGEGARLGESLRDPPLDDIGSPRQSLKPTDNPPIESVGF